MENIAGIFNSFADAKRGAAILRSLGFSEKNISVLSPHTKAHEIEAQVPIEDVEQPGIGPAVGGAVGAALGVAAGTSVGAATATLLIPGVGPVLALGLLGAAIFGTGGGAAGALVGEALEAGLETGLPHDELYLYEDALRRGRSVVIAFTKDEQIAERARVELKNAGAESVDTARKDWWLGLRDVEQEHYTNS